MKQLITLIVALALTSILTAQTLPCTQVCNLGAEYTIQEENIMIYPGGVIYQEVPPVLQTYNEQIQVKPAYQMLVDYTPASFVWSSVTVPTSPSITSVTITPPSLTTYEVDYLEATESTQTILTNNCTGTITPQCWNICQKVVPAVYNTASVVAPSGPGACVTTTSGGSSTTLSIQDVSTPAVFNIVEIPAEFTTVETTVVIADGYCATIPVDPIYETIQTRVYGEAGATTVEDVICDDSFGYNDAIKHIQQELVLRTFLYPSDADGTLNNNTKIAIEKFALSRGIPYNINYLNRSLFEELGLDFNSYF